MYHQKVFEEADFRLVDNRCDRKLNAFSKSRNLYDSLLGDSRASRSSNVLVRSNPPRATACRAALMECLQFDRRVLPDSERTCEVIRKQLERFALVDLLCIEVSRKAIYIQLPTMLSQANVPLLCYPMKLTDQLSPFSRLKQTTSRSLLCDFSEPITVVFSLLRTMRSCRSCWTL